MFAEKPKKQSVMALVSNRVVCISILSMPSSPSLPPNFGRNFSSQTCELKCKTSIAREVRKRHIYYHYHILECDAQTRQLQLFETSQFYDCFYVALLLLMLEKKETTRIEESKK